MANANNDFSQVNVEMVPGTTLEQTVEVTDAVVATLNRQPEVKLAVAVINQGKAEVYISLKKERTTTSIEFERRLAPELQTVPDARIAFASQSMGAGSGRDITVMLTGSDPELLHDTAQKLVDQMRGIPEAVAPRIAADLQRPELIIEPHFDLAAQLGVTTGALSEAIRIATMGEIDRDAAKFSLSDRQVPIRVILPKSSRRDLSTIANLPVPTVSGESVPLSRLATIRFGAGPTQIQRYNQARRIFIGADLAPGAVKGPVDEKIKKLPVMRDLPNGISTEAVGEAKMEQELVINFGTAVISGILLVFGVLVLLLQAYRFAAGQYDLAPARPVGWPARHSSAGAAAFDVGLHRHPDVAGHCRQELHPADRLRDRGNGSRGAQAGSDHRRRAQAGPADRDDDGRDDRGHGADGHCAVG